MLEKIVLITAGGHVSSFHAAMLEMYETLEKMSPGRFELCGADGGLSGFHNGMFIPIKIEDIDENRAGSMIGSDREHLDLDRAKQVIKDHNIYSVVMMGGDNHLSEAAKGFEAGLPFVGWPKTMDGDISSLITLGYETAVVNAVNFTKSHYNTAMTSEKVFYVVTFGRDTDWIGCGVSSYADVLSIGAEESYSWDFINGKISEDVKSNLQKYGVGFSVVHVSEGVQINEMRKPPEEHQKGDVHEKKLQPKWVALELERLSEASGFNSTSQVYEYILRDLPPTETDKRLAKMAGKECIEAILDGEFGVCPAFELNGDFYSVVRMPLIDVAKKSFIKGKGFFDYDQLKTTPKFLEIYGNLFRESLGEPFSRDELVYMNRVER